MEKLTIDGVQPKEYIIFKLKLDINKVWSQFQDALYRDKDNMRATYLRGVAIGFQEVLNRITDVESRPLPAPDDGDIFTKETFIQMCENCEFVSDDGTGYYASKDSMSNIEVLIPLVNMGFFDNRFTHVAWFNK